MVIAIDFDGTIVENRYPEIGQERPFALARRRSTTSTSSTPCSRTPSARWVATRLMKSWTKYVILPFLLLLCIPSYAQLNPDVDKDTTKWFNRTQQLSGVDVRAKRGRYSRKNNPAVEHTTFFALKSTRMKAFLLPTATRGLSG